MLIKNLYFFIYSSLLALRHCTDHQIYKALSIFRQPILAFRQAHCEDNEYYLLSGSVAQKDIKPKGYYSYKFNMLYETL